MRTYFLAVHSLMFGCVQLSSDDVVLIPSTAGQRDGGKVISEVDQPDAEQWNEGFSGTTAGFTFTFH